MKIQLVSGKGGVGKSAFAAALALKQAQAGKRVLLAELGEMSFYKNYFELKTVDSQPRKIDLGFDLALWSGESCLREYALHFLKIESLYRLFFENPVSKTLTQIAPGLSELAIIGKITSGPPRNVGPALNYDVLVVDAYSTGHFLALLRAPLGMVQSIRAGPIAEQSRKILSVLEDPKLCEIHLVALPEELPIKEVFDLEASVKSLFPLQNPQIWINKVIPFPSSFQTELIEHQSEFANRKSRQENLLSEVSRNSKQAKKLPFFFEVHERKIVEQLFQELSL